MATQLKDTIIETFKLDRENVDKVTAKIEGLVREGNARRAIVKNASGATLIEIPLTVGLVGVALAPVWAAIAAIAAVAADFTIQIERRDDGENSTGPRATRQETGRADAPDGSTASR